MNFRPGQLLDTVRNVFGKNAWRSQAESPAIPVIEGPVSLFFAPAGAFRVHFINLGLVARALAERGHNVLMLRCYRTFPVCAPAIARNQQLPPGEPFAPPPCDDCARHSVRLLGEFGLPSVNLAALVGEEERLSIRSRVEAVDFAAPDAGGLDSQLSHALIDFILYFKALDAAALDDERAQFLRRELNSVLLCQAAVERALQLYDVRRFVLYGHHSLHVSVRAIAEANSIPCFQIFNASHKNINFQKLVILDEDVPTTKVSRAEEWSGWKDIPLSPDEVAETADDLIRYRLNAYGSTVYSPGRSTDRTLGPADFDLDPGKRTVVAYTSSPDEVLAQEHLMRGLGKRLFNDGNLFADQVEWLEWLIAGVESSPDLQLVVRIHPREGRTKTRFESDHLRLLRQRLPERLGSRSRVVWPEDEVSSYGLADMADVVTVSWSTIGHELARLAVPVISPFPGRTRIPFDCFIHYPPDRDAYSQALRDAIGRPATWDDVTAAFRWHAYSSLGAAIDLSEVIVNSEKPNVPASWPPALCERMERHLIDGVPTREDNRKARLARLSAASAGEERRALVRQFRRLALYLMTGSDDWAAAFAGSTPQGAAAVEIPVPSVDGSLCTLAMPDGRQVARRSLMIARMLDLIGPWDR